MRSYHGAVEFYEGFTVKECEGPSNKTSDGVGFVDLVGNMLTEGQIRVEDNTEVLLFKHVFHLLLTNTISMCMHSVLYLTQGEYMALVWVKSQKPLFGPLL